MKALVKGTGLWVLGRLPGGAALYRKATREWMGTQASHVDKLARVAPGYFQVWMEHGFVPEGANVAILAPGLTTFWPMALHLAGCERVQLVQFHEQIIHRYIARAADGVRTSLSSLFPDRLLAIEAMKGLPTTGKVLESCAATEFLHVSPESLPLEASSVDLCHSGGVMEHFPPQKLRALVAACYRVLKPGGLCSNVFDHRDHLYHADKSLEPMNHLRHSEAVYRLLYGHPLLYHSRLSPTDVCAIFEGAGFQRLAVRRLTLPKGGYACEEEVSQGLLGCSRPARQFRHFSDADLRTAACHYLYRKPL